MDNLQLSCETVHVEGLGHNNVTATLYGVATADVVSQCESDKLLDEFDRSDIEDYLKRKAEEDAEDEQ